MNTTQKKPSFDQQVLEKLKKGSLTTYDIREVGPFHPAGVIARLRKEHTIDTTPVKVKDSLGIEHSRVASYSLVTDQKGGANNE
jgi:hypothetical protein